MIYQDVELHNVAEVVQRGDGVRLQRVPEDVRKELNEAARFRVLQPDNCELRFVSDDPEVRVTLSSQVETSVELFHGTFDGERRAIVGKEPTTLTMPLPSAERLRILDRRWWGDLPFAPTVRRLVFGGARRDPVVIHDIDGQGLRPPTADEVPSLRYLAYGTSITHGFFCEDPMLSYVGQTAWNLGADLINLGVGGACHCEAAYADTIAGRDDWDIATLALSVNMHEFDLGEFRRRVEYMVNTVAGANTTRPVACITLYPYYRDLGIEPANEKVGGTPEQFRQTLRDVVEACPHPNVHLLEGPKLLTNIGGLADDLIHPSGLGMIEMGRNLSAELQKLLAANG